MTKEESFWEENKIDQIVDLNDDLLFIPKRLTEIEHEVEQRKEELDYLELLRARQHKKLIDIQEEYKLHCDPIQYPEYEKMLRKAGKMVIDVSSIFDDQVLKIDLDFLLPIYHKTKNMKIAYYTALQDIYQRELILKLNHHKNELPNFYENPKVFVLIIQHFNNNNITDLDNRFHSFIFNALRSVRIISDDRWQRLSYMEDGRITEEKPNTEIFIGDYQNLVDILKLSN